MVLIAIALVVGLSAAYALAKLFSSVLYGVPTNDPITFAFVPVFLGTIALVACWLPARRASRINPQIVLRYE
jgi:putative ABC transport system permease protein